MGTTDNLIGAMLECIFYGFYCVIFVLYLQIQFKRKDEYKGILFYALTANFVLCTAYLAVSMAVALLGDILDPDQTSPEWISVMKLNVSTDALYTCIDFISQGILIYRCWMLWRKPLIVFLPVILTLSFSVITLTCIIALITAPGFNDPAGPVIPDWYLPAVVSIFSLSLAANAVVTSLIVYKIMSVYHDLRTVGNRASVRGSRGIYPVSILVESGLVTLAAQLVQTVLYKVDTNRFGIVSGVVVMLYGISSTIVLVRVVSGTFFSTDTTRIPSSNAIRFAGLESNDTQKFELSGTVHK